MHYFIIPFHFAHFPAVCWPHCQQQHKPYYNQLTTRHCGFSFLFSLLLLLLFLLLFLCHMQQRPTTGCVQWPAAVALRFLSTLYDLKTERQRKEIVIKNDTYNKAYRMNGHCMFSKVYFASILLYIFMPQRQWTNGVDYINWCISVSLTQVIYSACAFKCH